jgi:membrane associated rhomboid family serine protease
VDLSSLALIIAVSGGATSLLLTLRRRTVASPVGSALALILGGIGLYQTDPSPALVGAALLAWALGILLPARLLAAARAAAGRGDLLIAARWSQRLLWLRRRPQDWSRRDLYQAAHAWWSGDLDTFEAWRARVAADPKEDGALAGAWALTHQWWPLTAGHQPLSLQVRAHCEQGEVNAGIELAARLWPKSPSLIAARDARNASLAPLAFGGRRDAVEALLITLRTPAPVADLWRATAAWAAGAASDAEALLHPWRGAPDLATPLQGILQRRLADPPAPVALTASAEAVLDTLAHEVHAGAQLRMRGPAGFTWALLLSLCGVFAYQSWLGITGDTLYALGALYVEPTGPTPVDLRLLSYGWLHGNFAHLLVNTLGLWAMGPVIERAYGRWTAAALYLTCVLGAGATIIFFGSPGLTIGASGGVMGWLAAILVTLRRHPTTRGTRTARAATGLVVAVLAIQLIWELGQAGVSSSGHLGGLLTGLVAAGLLSVVLIRPTAPAATPPPPPPPR